MHQNKRCKRIHPYQQGQIWKRICGENSLIDLNFDEQNLSSPKHLLGHDSHNATISESHRCRGEQLFSFSTARFSLLQAPDNQIASTKVTADALGYRIHLVFSYWFPNIAMVLCKISEVNKTISTRWLVRLCYQEELFMKTEKHENYRFDT